VKVPIFPLNAVLFPDGILRLRIFEQRYLEMTKQCLRDEAPFGVCLIKEGSEVGTPAVPESVGCLATITHWDMPQLGVFTLVARGGARFRMLDQSVDRLGLITAEIECWDADPPGAVMAPACRRLVETLIEHTGRELFSEPARLDDPAWVGYRLAEVLPLPQQVRQELLELRDAGERLQRVAKVLADEGYTG
jgi:Lon protease-like protein